MSQGVIFVEAIDTRVYPLKPKRQNNRRMKLVKKLQNAVQKPKIKGNIFTAWSIITILKLTSALKK